MEFEDWTWKTVYMFSFIWQNKDDYKLILKFWEEHHRKHGRNKTGHGMEIRASSEEVLLFYSFLAKEVSEKLQRFRENRTPANYLHLQKWLFQYALYRNSRMKHEIANLRLDGMKIETSSESKFKIVDGFSDVIFFVCSEMKEAFDEILNNRLIGEIPPENPYVFAKAHSLSAIFYSRGLSRAFINLWHNNRNELKEVLGARFLPLGSTSALSSFFIRNGRFYNHKDSCVSRY